MENCRKLQVMRECEELFEAMITICPALEGWELAGRKHIWPHVEGPGSSWEACNDRGLVGSICLPPGGPFDVLRWVKSDWDFHCARSADVVFICSAQTMPFYKIFPMYAYF